MPINFQTINYSINIVIVEFYAEIIQNVSVMVKLEESKTET